MRETNIFYFTADSKSIFMIALTILNYLLFMPRKIPQENKSINSKWILPGVIYMNLKTGLISAAFVAITTAAAVAAPVNVAYQNPGSPFAGGAFNGTMTGANPASVAAGVGGLALKDTNPGGLGSFIAWCLDISTFLALPNAYTTTNTPFSMTTGAITPTRAGDIQKLFNTGYSATVTGITSAAVSAGFQLALWEILYETGSYGLTTGSFQASGDVVSAATNQANTLLGALSGPITQAYSLTFLESPKGANGAQLTQNLVTASAVPLPAAGVLLLTVMGGIGALARYKRKSAV